MTAKEEKKGVEKLVLEGRVMYAMVGEPRPSLQGVPQHGLVMEVDSDKIEELFDKGLSRQTKVRSFDEFPGVKFLRFTRDVTTKGGFTLPPLVVLGSDKTTFTKLIGNGSRVKIVVELLERDHPSFGKVTKARLAAVQVLDLIEYSPTEMTAAAVEKSVADVSDLLTDEGKGAVDVEVKKKASEFTDDDTDPSGTIS